MLCVCFEASLPATPVVSVPSDAGNRQSVRAIPHRPTPAAGDGGDGGEFSSVSGYSDREA